MSDSEQRGNPWSREEVEAIVADYFRMLSLELSGQSYSKTEHRRALAGRLDGRSEGSIERKHQNISAVMISCGCFYISGYKPLPNLQNLLRTVVEDRLFNDRTFQCIATEAAERPAVKPSTRRFGDTLVDAPTPVESESGDGVGDASPPYANRTGVFRDYLVLEARNRDLGLAGEEFVLAFEEYRLRQAGEVRLANRIEHVARTKGDGLGYDVLSFDTDGKERLIEVKTTVSGKLTPFYLTANELGTSRDHAEHYHLYRVFEFRRAPRLFDVPGNVDSYCSLSAQTYMARFA